MHVQLRSGIAWRYSSTTEGKALVLEKPLIACVDDDQAVCEAILGLLKVLGFIADAFSSAEEFLQSGRLDETSCLITDVQLGGMSGLQLQNRLAGLGYRIPVIVITAFPDEHVRDQALNAGAVSFLSKPVTKADLVRSIRSALGLPDDDEARH
jgi:FixJ family two-component response regulator